MSTASEAAGTAGDAAVPGEGEEGILVAIRMRPLNSRENDNRVWKVLQKHNAITQCTAAGKPLPERSQNRSFFSFDKTFGESSTTRQVYDQTSRGIVSSVANGLNGTIFAYGQTSSGKTYTMQGSGTLQEGHGSGTTGDANGGIVHMAASDLFNHIQKEPQRVFLVRVSFIEIYNEEVRDLLVSGDSKNNATLTVREDKRRGVFVNSNENIVTSMDSLLSVLFAGEKNRSVAATGMNERSSRSHTIFKITVESRLKQTKKDGDEDDEESDDEEDMMRGDDNGNAGDVYRVSTLNLVDLAGSESVRHTGATGDRQKEGGKINQSLLTLSRVIESVGQNATHVNFRDSKLTRILQPSLSGNARMAVICCATPSELYLEETRSTLQFASRAKLVKTKAQVNEIMDDRSLIKKLQRELREFRQGGPGKETMDQMKVLQEKAASAEYALKRMKTLILNGGVPAGTNSVDGSTVKPSLDNSLFVSNNNNTTIKTDADCILSSMPTKQRSKRRHSDSVIHGTGNGDLRQGHLSSPARGGKITKTQARTETKPSKSKLTSRILPSSLSDDVDIGLFREALAAKSALTSSLELKLNEAVKQAQAAEKKLQCEHGEKEMHRLAKQDLESQVSLLASNKELGLSSEQDNIMEDEDNVITTSLVKIEHMLQEGVQQATSMSELKTLVDSLQGQLSSKEKEHEYIVQTLNKQIGHQQECATAMSADLERKLEAAVNSNTALTNQVSSLKAANEDASKILSEKTLVLEEANLNASKLSKDVSDIRNAAVAAEAKVAALECELKAEKSAADLKRTEHKAAVDDVNCYITQLTGENARLQTSIDDTGKLLSENEVALDQSKSEIAALKEQVSSATQQFSKEVSELHSAKQAAEESLVSLEGQLKAATVSNTQLENQVASLQSANTVLAEQLREKQAALEEAASETAVVKEEHHRAKQTSEERVNTLEKSLSVERIATQELTQQLGAAKDDAVRLTKENNTSNKLIEELQSNLADMSQKSEKHIIAQQEAEKSLQAAKDAEQELEGNVSKLEATVRQRDDEVAVLNESSNSLQNKVSTLSSERDELVRKVEMTSGELVSVQEQLSGSVSEIEKLKLKVKEIGTESGIANEQVQELTSSLEREREALVAIQQEKDKLLLKVEGLESERDDCLNEAEAAIDDKEKMLGEMKAMEAEHDLLKQQCVRPTNQMSAETAKTKEFSDQVSKLESLVTERDAALSHLKSEKDLLTSNLENMEASVTCLEAEKKELLRKIESLSSFESEQKASTAQYNAVKLEHTDCMHKLEVVTRDNEKLKGIITNLESDIQDATKETQHSSVQIEQLEAQVSTLAQERDTLTTKVEEVSQNDRILSANEALDAKECIVQVDSGKTNSQVVSELNKKIADFQGSLDNSKTEVTELLSQAEKSEANYKALEAEKEDCLNKLRDELSTHVSEVEAKCKETVANLQNSLDKEKNEIIELKSLLSSANASVDEARSAALSSDQELENALRNLEKVEEARRIVEDKLRLAELSPRNSPPRTDSEEELLREMEILVGEKDDAESRLEQELARRKEVEDDMKKSLEEEKQLLINDAENKMLSLRDEISQLKSDLARVESDCYNMKDENADLRDAIKRVEAKAEDSESIATSVNVELARERDEKNRLQERLERLEEESTAFKSQVFAAKQAFEEAAQDKLENAEDQMNDALSQLAESRNESKSSKETIEELNRNIEEYRRELDSVKSMASHEKEIELSKLREELAQTKLNASHLETNYASVKRDLESSREKIDRIKRHEHEKQHKFAIKAQEKITALKDKLAKAELALTTAGTNKSAEDEVKALQTKVKELSGALLDKDARIKKLEKTKLTKTQIANIQKLKDERNQFMAEVNEYKQKVEELENAKPRRSGLRERTNSSQDSTQEIAKLKRDLRQCDLKLRKYVAHSEHLENVRKGVIEAISSCNDVEIVGDDVAEMVSSLCDNFTSLKEECDALSSTEGKAAEYLRNLDSLREKYASLEDQVQRHEEKNTKLTSALAESKSESEEACADLQKAKAQITSFQMQIKSMSASQDNISDLQSEHRHQLHHLSNENLDLGQQLKSAKEELALTKKEFSKYKLGDSKKVEEQTEELQGLRTFLGSSTLGKRSLMESKSKRAPSLLSGDKKIPLGPGRKRFSESPMTKGEEKENFVNKKQKTLSASMRSPFRSAKENSTNPFSSANKSAQRKRASQKDDTPTKRSKHMLGDAEPTADVTGECNQS